MTTLMQLVKRFWKITLAGGLMLLVLIQFVQFMVPEVRISNPPATRDIQWDSSETEALWNRACRDCHSNDTVWPWYSRIAPVTWLVAHDVNEGRREFNISTTRRIEIDEMEENIDRNKMPPSIYLVMHPEADLTRAEKDQLIAGLNATFGRRGR